MGMTSAPGPRVTAGPARAAALTMTLICAAQFVLQLDFSIVNVALPTIQRDLAMPAAELQWIVTGYALTFGSLLLVGGRLADLLGRRRLLIAGLVLFALASLACGLAQWPVMLIIARIVQGAAGAMVSPAALSLLTTTNPEGPARNRALSIWQATTAAGATRFAIKPVLVAGLVSMVGGQLWLSQISVSSSYAAAVLPGLLLTSVGIGLALPTASIAITAGVQGRDQGLAGALFTTGQQTGAAVGLAVLATVAAARTAHAAGSLTAGYRLSFLVATGIALLATVLAAWRLGSRDCQQQELARQQPGPGAPGRDACRSSAPQMLKAQARPGTARGRGIG